MTIDRDTVLETRDLKKQFFRKLDVAAKIAAAIGADVANKFQCVHLVESTRSEWGQLDILVNHAA